MDRINAEKDNVGLGLKKDSKPDDKYDQMVDGVSEKCNFVMACFDTVYFLNEDKR